MKEKKIEDIYLNIINIEDNKIKKSCFLLSIKIFIIFMTLIHQGEIDGQNIERISNILIGSITSISSVYDLRKLIESITTKIIYKEKLENLTLKRDK